MSASNREISRKRRIRDYPVSSIRQARNRGGDGGRGFEDLACLASATFSNTLTGVYLRSWLKLVARHRRASELHYFTPSTIVVILVALTNRIVLAGLIGTLWHHGVVYANTAMAWVPAYGILDSVNALQTDLGRGRTVAQP